MIDIDILQEIDIDEITVSFMVNINSEIPYTLDIGTEFFFFLTLSRVTILSHLCLQL